MRRAALVLALACALAGCGVGQGEERGGDGAEVRVTRDFGQKRLSSTRVEPVRDDDTVMRALQRDRKVELRYGGKFVQSIDGLTGEEAEQRGWLYFVNGTEADVGAADFELSPGDVVQWDYRYWGGAMRVPRIVGAYPEPFVHGYRGKRFPVRVECEAAEGAACRLVKRKLTEEGVPANGAALGTTAGEEVIRVVVARWAKAKELSSVEAIADGPEASGVFVRDGEGGRLELLDARTHARPAPPGTGLVAATAPEGQGTLWVVTGDDDAAVDRAAGLLDEATLRDAFAVAATPDGPVRLPLEAP